MFIIWNTALSNTFLLADYKQLLDEVSVISRSRLRQGLSAEAEGWSWYPLPRPWLFWISQKLNIIIVFNIIHRTKKWKSCFCFFTGGKQHNACKLDMITRDLECPWHDYCIICSYDVMGADFESSLYAFGQSEKS